MFAKNILLFATIFVSIIMPVYGMHDSTLPQENASINPAQEYHLLVDNICTTFLSHHYKQIDLTDTFEQPQLTEEDTAMMITAIHMQHECESPLSLVEIKNTLDNFDWQNTGMKSKAVEEVYELIEYCLKIKAVNGLLNIAHQKLVEDKQIVTTFKEKTPLKKATALYEQILGITVIGHNLDEQNS